MQKKNAKEKAVHLKFKIQKRSLLHPILVTLDKIN